jgi:hypothetical protein
MNQEKSSSLRSVKSTLIVGQPANLEQRTSAKHQFHALVSDSHNTIKVKFTEEAKDTYENEKSKRFTTHGKTGAVLGITDYSLVRFNSTQ